MGPISAMKHENDANSKHHGMRSCQVERIHHIKSLAMFATEMQALEFLNIERTLVNGYFGDVAPFSVEYEEKLLQLRADICNDHGRGHGNAESA